MSEIKIELVVAIEGLILAVYYSHKRCYQFSVIDEFETAFNFDEILYSLEAAEARGREAVKELFW